MCELYGYPDSSLDAPVWRSRHWHKFYSDHPRGTSTVTTDTLLNREHDTYPVFSRELIDLLYSLGRVITHHEPASPTLLTLLHEATGQDCTFLLRPEQVNATGIARLIRITTARDAEEKLWDNGVIPILRWLGRLHKNK